MKKRWMKSVIEASTQELPTLPFNRSVRCEKRKEMLTSALRKSA